MTWKFFLGESADVFPGIIARNHGMFNYERFIHRTFYPHIIHPYSKFRVYWELTMLFFWLFQVVVFLFIWGFVSHTSVLYMHFLTLLQLINFIDLVLMFYTGYVEKDTEIVVLDPKKIAIRYLSSSFILDLLASIPFEVITFFMENSCSSNKLIGMLEPCELIIYASALGFFCRVGSYNRYLKNTARVRFWNPFFFNLIAFGCYFFLIIFFHFLYTCFYIILSSGKFNRGRPLWKDFFMFFKHFYLIVFNYFFDVRVELDWDCTILIPILIFNFFFSMYLTSYLIKYARFKMRTKERYLALESSVRIFVRRRQMPFSLKQKTLLYFQVFLQSSHYKADEIVNYFPNTFKSDMFSHLCIPLLKGFYAFEDLPTYVLRRLAECLKYQLYLPNEIVMKRKEPKLSMYFIQTGTVALYSANSTELYHFEDGGCFNGKQFLEENSSRNHYAVSLEVTELYRMDHEDFMDIMAAYPKLLRQIQKKFVMATTENHDLID